jgi:hypothetical protein
VAVQVKVNLGEAQEKAPARAPAPSSKKAGKETGMPANGLLFTIVVVSVLLMSNI